MLMGWRWERINGVEVGEKLTLTGWQSQVWQMLMEWKWERINGVELGEKLTLTGWQSQVWQMLMGWRLERINGVEVRQELTLVIDTGADDMVESGVLSVASWLSEDCYRCLFRSYELLSCIPLN